MSRIHRILGIKGDKVSAIMLTTNQEKAREKFRDIRAKKDLNFDFVEYSEGKSPRVKKVRMITKKKASKAE